MNKYLFITIIFLLFSTTLTAQKLRQITDHGDENVFDILFYKSDSVLFSSNYYLNSFYNGKYWTKIFFSSGIMFTEPNSKIYFLTETNFCQINPVTYNDENCLKLQLSDDPYYFKVFKDSFFISYGLSDTIVCKFDFNDKKITKKTILFTTKKYEITYSKLQVMEDSLMFYSADGNLFKKNLITGTLTTIISNGSLYELSSYKKNMVMADKGRQLLYSADFGKTFLKIVFTNDYMRQLSLTDNYLHYYNWKGELVTRDFSGNLKWVIKPSFIFGEFGKWLNDSTFQIITPKGDIFRVSAVSNQITYIGGSFGFGIEKAKFCKNGKLVFFETKDKLWTFSSDTGKHWKIPLIQQKAVTKAEFVDSTLIILCNKRLCQYHFSNNTFDSSLYSLGLKITNFLVLDKQILFLFTSTGNYKLNLKTNALTQVGPFSSFENCAYLQKTNRLIAIGGDVIYYSDDYAKTWTKSSLSGFTFFGSLDSDIPFEVKETINENISFKVLFNGMPTIIRSNDGGKNFFLKEDTIHNKSFLSCRLYDDIYSLDSFNRVLHSDINSKLNIADTFYSAEPASGMQAVDSGFFIWNSRGKIFYKKVPYRKMYTYSEKFTLFPNPVNSNSSIYILIPKNYSGRIETIEIYDMPGKKQDQTSFEYLQQQNIYQVKNLPEKASQFYVIVIKTFDGKTHRAKVFIH